MFITLPGKKVWGSLAAAFALLSVGCTAPDTETTSALVDLLASTSGGLVEILVKAAVNALLAVPNLLDLTAPISEQFK